MGFPPADAVRRLCSYISHLFQLTRDGVSLLDQRHVVRVHRCDHLLLHRKPTKIHETRYPSGIYQESPIRRQISGSMPSEVNLRFDAS